MQAVGAWLFIAGAILRLELHVVPSRTRVQLQAAVEEQRWLAGTPGALVLIDVDGLKSVNDTLGHQAGDDVLRHVADAIRTQLRATDIAARIGGDEFAVILPETATHQAQAVAQRFVASLHDTSVDGMLRTSVSAGVASIEGILSPADVMKRADIALYQAKRAGGDRYAMSGPVPQPQSA